MAINRRPAPIYLHKRSKWNVDALQSNGDFAIYKCKVARTVLSVDYLGAVGPTTARARPGGANAGTTC